MEQRIIVEGKSDSLISGYGRALAQIALQYNKLPTALTNSEITEYLYEVSQRYKTPSRSFFKFVVYSLRYVCKVEGLTEMRASLPVLKHDKKLPVVLSREEVRKLIAVTEFRKHRVLLLLFYGCGLRRAEAAKLKRSHLDFDRKMLMVQGGKGGKDRYVPMSSLLISEIVIYLDETKPVEYLFGQPVARFNKDRRQFYSFKGICFVIQQASEKAKIEKKVSPHTLRHTFATHLLEDGLDIVTIKNLLGHQHIETTMIYLHVAQCDRYRAFSPLDTLYGIRKSNFNADPIAPSRQCPFLCADAAPVPDYATSTNH